MTNFWAKYDEKTGEWLSINDHSADVAACFETLISETILRKRLACLLNLNDLDEVLISRLCVFAALHDIGKYSNGFQNRGPNSSSSNFTSDHLTPVIDLLQSYNGKLFFNHFFDSINGKILCSWFENEWVDFLKIFKTTIGHHGKPVAISTTVNHSLCWGHNNFRNPFQGISNLMTAIQEWYPIAFISSRAPIQFNAEWLHAFAGILMLADWLGSNRKAFPYATPLNTSRINNSRHMAKEIAKRTALCPNDYRNDFIGTNASLGQIFNVPSLRSLQKTIADLPLPSKSSLVILESETGSGKTEAAMAHFFNLYKNGLVDSLYFALPTRTAATQLYNRIIEFMRRGFNNPPPITLAVPGYLKSDNIEGYLIDRFEVAWDDAQKEEITMRHWAAEEPRKYLAGSIVIGTIDQILLSALQVPYAPMRASALLRHLLVIDEIHASDSYMTKIVERTLNFHLQAGGHALLMSATLSSDAKENLLKSFTKCKNNAFKIPPSSTNLNQIPYPLLTIATNSESITKTISFKNETQPKTIHTSVSPICGDPTAIARVGLEAALDGAKVIILRNTVRDAVNTQHALETLATSYKGPEILFSINGKITLHHARFCKEDREELDLELQKIMGKNRPIGGFILVATQTIQQSLDLDADFMLTDLCPMDVLLQRFGRLHRHQRPLEERPKTFRNPSAIVMTPDECLGTFIKADGSAKGPHGLGTVYDNLLILETSLQLLKKEKFLEIPTHNRKYIEETIPDTILNLSAKVLGKEWINHYEFFFGKKCGQIAIASHNLIDREQDYPDCTFPNTNERISTRLGIDDRIIKFESQLRSPFGNTFNKLTLPGYLLASISIEISPTNICQLSDCVTFNFGNKSFIYDRLGLREDVRLDGKS